MDLVITRLLIDFLSMGSMGSGFLDFQRFNFPPGGPVASLSGNAGDTIGDLESLGDVVQFGYTLATPEPSACALMLGDLGAMMAIRRRRNHPRA